MNFRRLLCLMCAAAVLLPIIANAEFYKWKDKNGAVRYSDKPPAPHIKAKVLGKKKTKKPVKTMPLIKGESVATESQHSTGTTEGSREKAARKRQINAEKEKIKKEAAAEKSRVDEANCKSAKKRYHTYKIGGRIVRVNENGEQEFLGDEQIDSGLEEAQSDINEYCY